EMDYIENNIADRSGTNSAENAGPPGNARGRTCSNSITLVLPQTVMLARSFMGACIRTRWGFAKPQLFTAHQICTRTEYESYSLSAGHL
ncbi:hypothetical protein, partial [Mesorhizobium sp. M7A.F.Ca.US.006.04.2.1]|uniref:hypothetical protein n=1 Tax=Mesorhizobium sp. M7A.F.Ca.US.006.04.2.1 TaxID=2496696 RepID=UPI0019D43921